MTKQNDPFSEIPAGRYHLCLWKESGATPMWFGMATVYHNDGGLMMRANCGEATAVDRDYHYTLGRNGSVFCGVARCRSIPRGKRGCATFAIGQRVAEETRGDRARALNKALLWHGISTFVAEDRTTITSVYPDYNHHDPNTDVAASITAYLDGHLELQKLIGRLLRIMNRLE